MNIFVLSLCVNKCTEMYVNTHVVKMCLETAQILSTAHRILAGSDEGQMTLCDSAGLYRITHRHHPCVKWTCASKLNYLWLVDLFSALLNEYRIRFDRIHACSRLLTFFTAHLPKDIPITAEMTPFALVMPAEIKERFPSSDPAAAYRAYYLEKKSHLFSWKRRPVPDFVVTCAGDKRSDDILRGDDKNRSKTFRIVF
jgi:hypothetical protein